jgi:hypothetical protein
MKCAGYNANPIAFTRRGSWNEFGLTLQAGRGRRGNLHTPIYIDRTAGSTPQRNMLRQPFSKSVLKVAFEPLRFISSIKHDL